MLTNRLRIVIVIVFLGLAIWAITLSTYDMVIGNSGISLWFTEALTSVGPELAGIVIGVVTIDYLNERRQDEQLKEQLILQMGSKHNDVTDTALRTLRARGWLEDGSLKGANLMEANLQGAFLRWANLEGTYLADANLKRTDLWGANLEGADLRGANLEGTFLVSTNLKEAKLTVANLEGAFLRRANLKEANLDGASLKEVYLGEANREGVIMPDGTKLKGPDYPEGPTYEEWRALQNSNVDEQAVAEIDEAMGQAILEEE